MKLWLAATLSVVPLALLMSGKPAVAEDDQITVRIKPDIVFAEQRGPLTRLNFDFELFNSGDQAQEITYIELRLFDASDAIVGRRYMGANGLPGPIAMLPDRQIPAGGSLYLFNPFADMDLPRPAERALLRVFHTGGSLDIDIPLEPQPSPNLVRPPMKGVSYVYAGSDLFAHHRRVALNSDAAQELGMEHIAQRYALDFTLLDPETGSLATGDGATLSDWLAFGASIVAPVDGEVVAVRAGMADNSFDESGQRVFADGFSDYGEDAGLGNFVILKTESGYLVLAHFKQGTLTVGVKDQVKAGQPLGLLGLSGDTAYPHLHIQLQDGPDILAARPIPIVFDCVVRAGEPPGSSAIDTGDFVSACAAP